MAKAGAGLKAEMTVAIIPAPTAILASFCFFWMAIWKLVGGPWIFPYICGAAILMLTDLMTFCLELILAWTFSLINKDFAESAFMNIAGLVYLLLSEATTIGALKDGCIWFYMAITGTACLIPWLTPDGACLRMLPP